METDLIKFMGKINVINKDFSQYLDEEKGIEFFYPSPIFCTDNAAMIGVAAYYEYLNGTRHGWDLNAVPNLKLGER